MKALKTRTRINVLCAPTSGVNPGMTTVDLGFAEFAASAGFDDVVYWRLWDSSEWLLPDGTRPVQGAESFYDLESGLTYRNLRGRLDEFLDADAIVYWGDFLHMQSYLEITTDVLTRRTDLIADRPTARDLAERYLLLKGQDGSVLDRVISYGTTLGFNSAYDYRDEYGGLLHSFLSRARRVLTRDTYSALIAQLHRPGRDETTKGTDGALLLGQRATDEREPTLGVFIGRSNLRPAAVGALGRELAGRLHLRPMWLDWGREPGFWPMNLRRALRLTWPGLELRAESPSLQARWNSHSTVLLGRDRSALPAAPTTIELLDQLSRHSIVLTDTYHVAVNAWRLGTPAICLIDAPRSSDWDVNSGGASAGRDKRAELYSQFDAAPLLVDSHQLDGSIAHLVDRLVGFLRDDELVEVIHARVGELRAHGRAQLSAALHGLIDSDTSAGAARATTASRV